jgi:hypothetical protein
MNMHEETQLNHEIAVAICDRLDLLLPTLPLDQALIVHAIDLEDISPLIVATRLKIGLTEVFTQLKFRRQAIGAHIGELFEDLSQDRLTRCGCQRPH